MDKRPQWLQELKRQRALQREAKGKQSCLRIQEAPVAPEDQTEEQDPAEVLRKMDERERREFTERVNSLPPQERNKEDYENEGLFLLRQWKRRTQLAAEREINKRK